MIFAPAGKAGSRSAAPDAGTPQGATSNGPTTRHAFPSHSAPPVASALPQSTCCPSPQTKLSVGAGTSTDWKFFSNPTPAFIAGSRKPSFNTSVAAPSSASQLCRYPTRPLTEPSPASFVAPHATARPLWPLLSDSLPSASLARSGSENFTSIGSHGSSPAAAPRLPSTCALLSGFVVSGANSPAPESAPDQPTCS